MPVQQMGVGLKHVGRFASKQFAAHGKVSQSQSLAKTSLAANHQTTTASKQLLHQENLLHQDGDVINGTNSRLRLVTKVGIVSL